MMKMKSTTTYNKWDIVLLPFPFTQKNSSKQRPALIISPKEFNQEQNVIILQISSNKDEGIDSYKIKEWEQANLPLVSYIKMKFATIKKEIILKKIGRLSEADIKIFKNYL